MRSPHATIRESIMYMFTRSAGAGADDPALSDEAAFVIQLILDDLWLWFNTVYGEQARRYAPKEVPLGERPPDPDDALPDDPF
ncbi:hypothetical protein [Burkholderia ubonensis]|uniref:hypothetical protein n=1 Tax=Burkholderia ubonensis TaxID=101571 RepID=UPI0007563790|nr:hypothetical protein [Burkholderia ubonensis]KVD80836.1 hypothetical protein WI88_19925 [Burkholderia ubonensis]